MFDSVEDPSFSGDTIEGNLADNGNGGGVYVAKRHFDLHQRDDREQRRGLR